MATYIMLSNLTDEGRKTLKERPERLQAVNKEIESMGARVTAQYAVLGGYDFVNIIEAPTNEVMARLAVELGSRGTIQAQRVRNRHQRLWRAHPIAGGGVRVQLCHAPAVGWGIRCAGRQARAAAALVSHGRRPPDAYSTISFAPPASSRVSAWNSRPGRTGTWTTCRRRIGGSTNWVFGRFPAFHVQEIPRFQA